MLLLLSVVVVVVIVVVLVLVLDRSSFHGRLADLLPLGICIAAIARAIFANTAAGGVGTGTTPAVAGVSATAVAHRCVTINDPSGTILSVSRSCRMLRYSIDAPTRPHDWASAAASRRSWLCSVMCVKLSRAAGSAARAPGKWHHEGGALRRRRAAHRGRSESMAGPSSNFLESVLLR